MQPARPTAAVVIGAGMAGLMVARVLSDRVDNVTIIERDQLLDVDSPRRGVPQGRHAHVLLGAGQRLLEEWFPGLGERLVADGAVPVDNRDTTWHQAGGYRARADLGFEVLSMSRPLLETSVRRRLLGMRPNVTVLDGTRVHELLMSGARTVGVRSDRGPHLADLVVDCSGRSSAFLDQLVGRGFALPETSEVRIDVAYGTRVLARRPGEMEPGTSVAVVIGEPTDLHRIGTVVPVEGDRWILTVGSFHGDTPPTDPDDFADFVRSLPSQVIGDILDQSDPLSPVMTHRMVASRRRHMERLDRTSPGFLLLGDSICSFNPIYGQGMSSAAQQARELGRAIDRHGIVSLVLARSFYRRAARVVDVPWRVAAAADFADPRTTGDKPAGTDAMNRFMGMVLRACHTSRAVARRMGHVQNLLVRPRSLMTPSMLLRILVAERRSPARASLHSTQITASQPTDDPSVGSQRAGAQAPVQVLIR